MNKEDKDWAVTSLSDLRQIPTISFPTRLMVAFKRGMALAIDSALLFLLTATPFLFCSLAYATYNALHDARLLYHLIAPLDTTFFVASLATPFPLIYLHFFFKNYMYHLTPGQAIAAIAYSPEDKNCTTIWRAVKCGLARYMTVLVVTFFACSLAGYCGNEWGDASMFRAILLVCSSFLFTLTLVHFSFSNRDLRSPLDRMFAMKVTVISRKQKNEKRTVGIRARKTRNVSVIQS